MDKNERPQMMSELPWTRGDKINNALSTIFPEWSSTRISRWLGVNPRTVQRWLRAGRGEFADEQIPADVSAKILDAANLIENIELGDQLDRWIDMHLADKPEGTAVHPEILAAYIAHRYKKLTGRDID